MSIKHAPRLNINGERDEKLDISESRLRLVLRVVDRNEFAAEWHGRWPISEIAKKWDIEESDAANLRRYWALPDRARPTANGHSINTNELFDRLRDEFRPLIKQMVDEAVAEAIR